MQVKSQQLRMSKTLIIYGFPPDVIQRELTNLLWALPDFDTAWLVKEQSRRGLLPIGVARFYSVPAAASAVKALHYHSFDRDYRLRCELASHDVPPGRLPTAQPCGRLQAPPVHGRPHPPPRTARQPTTEINSSDGPSRTDTASKIFIGKLSGAATEVITLT